MEELIRFEPYYGFYIFSQDGEIYEIDKLPEDDMDNLFIVDRKNKPVPFNGLSSPIQVQIQYTNRCNMRCPSCYSVSGIPFNKELTEDELKNLLISLKKMGVLEIEWSGGEAFTRKNFLNIVKYTKDLGFEQRILTNGYAIGKLYSDTSFLWKLFNNIQISIDGFNKSFNEWVGRDVWIYVKSAVENLYKTKLPYTSLSLTTTLDKKNLPDLYLIAKWLNGKDILWKIGQQVPIGRSVIKNNESVELLDFSYKKISKLRERYKLNVIHQYDKIKPEENSMFPLEWHTEVGARWFMYIKANGDVYPFPYWDGFLKFKAGNVLIDNLEDIWYSKAFNLYRSATRERTSCANCKLICQMWPRSFSSFDGNLFATPRNHPNCPIASSLK